MSSLTLEYEPFTLTVHFSMTCSVRYQPIFHTLYFMLHYACVLNNVVITTIIEMVEMVEILDGSVGKRSVERVWYVINNLLHLVIVKYTVISLVSCISTCLQLVIILMLLLKYLVIIHADLCNGRKKKTRSHRNEELKANRASEVSEEQSKERLRIGRKKIEQER